MARIDYLCDVPEERIEPGRAAHVRRERILHAIETADPPALAIVAPAGWGKSCLLADWAAARPGIVVRTSLAPRHGDADVLLEALALCCAQAAAEAPEAWLDRTQADGRPPEARLRRMLARLPAASALALDDVHAVLESAGAATLLDELMALARGGTIRLALASRSMPPCIRARDLVHGAAMRIDASALAMDDAEIARFFRGAPGADDPAFLEDARRRTRGWPAGLRILWHRASRDTATAIADQSAEHALAEYFDAEILAPLPRELRTALADLALPDRIDEDCCRVLGADTALLEIETLARDGLFVTRAGEAYELHPMFREHLLRRGRERDGGRIAGHLAGLARWHAGRGRTRESLESALAALAVAARKPDALPHEYAELAAECLEAAVPDLLQIARRDRVEAAATAIPEEALRARPYLVRLLRWARGEFEPAGDPPHDSAPTRCLDELLRAARSLRAMRFDEVADAALRARAALPDDDAFLRNAVVSVLQAAFRFGGSPHVGRAALDEAARLAEDVRRPAAAVQAGAMHGILLIMHGRLHAAEAALRRALAIADARLDPDSPVRAMAHQFLAYVLHPWNRLDEAARELERARTIAEPIEHRGILTGVLRVLAIVRLHQGDRAGADEAMNALALRMEGPSIEARNREWMDGVRAAFGIAAGDASALPGWIARHGYAPDAITRLPSPQIHFRLQEYTTLAHALVLLGRCEDAVRIAAALETAARAANRHGFQVAAAATAAAACETLGRRADADAALARALGTAAPENMIRPIADTPGPIAAALARARPNGVPLAFLEAVRRCAGDAASPAGLTDREREILVLLAGGHSNKALARTLGVSVSTVKTHLHNAFRKLGARSRTHALARARELGVLGEAPPVRPSPAGTRTGDGLRDRATVSDVPTR